MGSTELCSSPDEYEYPWLDAECAERRHDPEGGAVNRVSTFRTSLLQNVILVPRRWNVTSSPSLSSSAPLLPVLMVRTVTSESPPWSCAGGLAPGGRPWRPGAADLSLGGAATAREECGSEATLCSWRDWAVCTFPVCTLFGRGAFRPGSTRGPGWVVI